MEGITLLSCEGCGLPDAALAQLDGLDLCDGCQRLQRDGLLARPLELLEVARVVEREPYQRGPHELLTAPSPPPPAPPQRLPWIEPGAWLKAFHYAFLGITGQFGEVTGLWSLLVILVMSVIYVVTVGPVLALILAGSGYAIGLLDCGILPARKRRKEQRAAEAQRSALDPPAASRAVPPPLPPRAARAVVPQATPSNLAPRTARVAAVFLDILVLTGPLICILSTQGVNKTPADWSASAIFLWVVGVLGFQVHGLATVGQSLGKRAMGLKVVRLDGAPARAATVVLLRAALPLALAFIPYLGVIFWALNVLFVFGHSRRCLHDLMAGTMVVRTESVFAGPDGQRRVVAVAVAGVAGLVVTVKVDFFAQHGWLALLVGAGVAVTALHAAGAFKIFAPAVRRPPP
jgi:uncharacterized RDD family membrane protein YckC